MPRPADLNAVRRHTRREVGNATRRYERLTRLGLSTEDHRWLACMKLVQMHSAWERFAERRLVAELNHHPEHFLTEYQVGVTRVPVGLADYVVKGGRPFFNFSNMQDLDGTANRLVTRTHNPFKAIPTQYRNDLDVAAALRNHILHASDASRKKMGDELNNHFSFRTIPDPGVFLLAKERRKLPRKLYPALILGDGTRLFTFTHMFYKVIEST